MGQGWFEHLIWMKSLEGFYCKSHLAREALRVLQASVALERNPSLDKEWMVKNTLRISTAL